MPRASRRGLTKEESKVVALRVPLDLAAAWERYCQELGEGTAQETMRAVMLYLTNQPADMRQALGHLVSRALQAQERQREEAAKKVLVPATPHTTTNEVDRGQKHKVTILLTPSENEAISRIAQERECSRQFWITSLVRAALTKGLTVGGAELKALGEFNYQLMAIGRNLNQIAHQINSDPDKNLHRLRVVELQKLGEQIKEGREYTHALVDACSHRWEIVDARN